MGAVDVQDADDEEWGSTPIALDSERAELLQFLVTDVRQATSEIDPIISELSDITSRPEAAERLVAMASGLAKVGEFFDFRTFTRLLDLLRVIGLGIDTVADEHLGELSLRLRGIGSLFDQFCSGLEVGMEMHWPLRTLERRIGHLLGGRSLHPDFTEYHRGDVDRVLEVDRVTEGIEPLPEPESETVARAAGSASPSAGAAPSGSSTATPTVRVPRDAIAELVSLVRQLVLNKNQFESIADEAGGWGLAVSRTEPLKLRASEYGRLIDQLQTTLNTARTQPVEVVVGRYERMVRDVAQIGDKSVHFLVEGGDVAVDKFVLDAIADPIGRLLRRTVSSEIETTADRAAAGKPETATISVTTSDHGSHVVIELSHDGREPNPSEIREHARALSPAGVAVEALADEYLLAAVHRGWMTDSDTAGVAELVEAQGGTLSVACDSGLIRTRLSLPVEGAVMSMMYVGIGDGAYAVPVSNIREVVPLHTCTLSNVKGERIARIRDSIFPVVDGAERFGAAGVGERRIAVILSIDGYSAALLVERMLGQQEVVLEPLGLDADQCGPFLGATILNSGSVGLAIDVRALLAV
ncbi:MAG: chemotaxis protein CheW [Planctomycetota bacterium]